jgi:protein TonB
MRRKPSVLLVSIAAHAVVLVLLATAPLWSPIDDWPMPRDVFAFSEVPRLAQARDIDLPRPAPSRAPRAAPGGVPAPDPSAAPVTAPDSITPETGERSAPTGFVAGGDVPSAGTIDGAGLGAASTPPPPPPAPQTQQPIRIVGPLLRAPAKLVHVSPQYPQVARMSRVQGVVILETVIDVNGDVASVSVLRSIPLLDQAALDAVRQWKFTPTLLNGTPVPIVMTVTVQFKLSD